MKSLNPLESVGEIRFNESRANAREKLGPVFQAGVKEFGSVKDFYDHYVDLGIFVFYDAHDTVSAVEFFDVPGPSFNGMDLLTVTYNELVTRVLKEFDSVLEEDGAGSFTSYSLGIAGYSSEENERCESIIVFRKGYYNNGNSDIGTNTDH